ncbi:MAG TPA: YihY/virulence factor BrkB family protein [Tepidisphaeraceae bacterium]|jgi:membrane protein
MARLIDVPVVLRQVGIRRFGLRVFNEVIDDHVLVYSAALAYSWLFAIFPFLIFLFSLIPYLPGRDHTHTLEEIEFFLRATLPDQAERAIWSNMQEQINEIIQHPERGVAIASLVVALWAASGGVAMTMAALDKCYEIDRPRAYWKRRPLAFGLTLLVATLVVVILALLPVGTAIKNYRLMQSETVSYWTIWVFDLLRGCLAIVAMFFALAAIYHFGPCVKRRWRMVTPGAVFCVIVWVALALLFRWYMSHFGEGKYNHTYGRLGGVAVLLLVFYVDALVLLVGAEVNSEIDYEVLKVVRGSRDFRAAEAGRPALAQESIADEWG